MVLGGYSQGAMVIDLITMPVCPQASAGADAARRGQITLQPVAVFGNPVRPLRRQPR